MGDDARKLGRNGDQEGLFVITEATGFGLLHHQNPKQVPLVNNGSTHETGEVFLPQAGYQLEAGVGAGVVQIQHLAPGSYPAHQPLIPPQGKFADLAGVQAFIGPEHQPAAGSIGQVDGTDVGNHRPSYLVHDQ